MEMTDKQIVRRMLGMQGGINPNYIRTGTASTFAHDALLETIRQFEQGPPFHLLRGSFEKSVGAVDAAIQQYSPDIVYIDASYLMSPSVKSGFKKPHELIADVGKEVKEMALARNKPVVQTVQFNREQRKTKGKPDLIHIGGSDVVGQISTIAMALQHGGGGFESTRRTVTVMKSRESSDEIEFQTNFLFNPPNFDYVIGETANDDDEGAADAAWEA
jgi:replicative DNA helicase